MSPKALELLKVLFAKESNLQLPVGVASEVIEIQMWVEDQLNAQSASQTTGEKRN